MSSTSSYNDFATATGEAEIRSGSLMIGYSLNLLIMRSTCMWIYFLNLAESCIAIPFNTTKI